MPTNDAISLNHYTDVALEVLCHLIENNEIDQAIALFEKAFNEDQEESKTWPGTLLKEAMWQAKNPGNCLILLEALQKKDPQNKKWQLPSPNEILSNHIFGNIDGVFDISKAFNFILSLKQYNNVQLQWFKFLNEAKCNQLISYLSETQQQNGMMPLLETVIASGNITLIWAIAKVPELYEAANKELSKNSDDASIALREMLHNLGKVDKIENTKYKEFATKHVNNLLTGFGFIDYDCGRLVAAAMTERKEITPPTIIKVSLSLSHSIDDYLSSLKEATPPICERFIISSKHWLSGQINIDENGHASMLIIDSMGYDKEKGIVYSRQLIRSFASHFPDHSIYLSAEKRQNSLNGCSVFALDDIRNLYNLPAVNKTPDNDMTLFTLLKNRNIESLIFSDPSSPTRITVNLVSLPPQLLRTMQSKQLLNILKEEANAESLINKKGMKGAIYSTNQIGFFNPNHEGNTIGQNTRLKTKLSNILIHTINYLASHDYATVEQQMAACSVDGFQNRMASRQRPPQPR